MFLSVIAVPFILAFLVLKIPASLQTPSTPAIMTSGMHLLSLLIAALIASWGYLALLFAIKDNEEKITIFTVYKRAIQHFSGFLHILILTIAVVGVGYMCLGIPGVIFSVWLFAGVLVYLVEDIRGMDALLLSKRYVEKFWFPVFNRLLFIGLIMSCFYLPVLVSNFFGLQLVSEILQLIITIIVLPIVSIFAFLLYGNLRLLKGDTSEYVTLLHQIPKAKEKLVVFKSALLRGALAGIPLALVLVYLFVTRPFMVQGDSMAPNYVTKEIIMTAYSSDIPAREDVIIFHSPTDPKKFLIKRIIGLPGEEIVIRGSGVFINNIILNESAYIPNGVPTTGGNFLQDNYVFRIPEGNYVVMGDNRPNSQDSREWGLVRRSDILGRAGACIWACPKKK
jgi:signal peptidase I